MTCCPCDRFDHPPKPDIAAGLSALPRQLAGFPEYRRAMLGELRTHPPLAGWRAREGDDLGLMLIEMWAYVLDVLGFYDERIADESYLRTAVLRPSLRKLVGLIGYRPRPALAASVVLAAIADGRQPVALPAATAFRSEAFEDEPPQVFETEVESVIAPKQNQWALGPVRGRFPDPGGDLLLEAASAGLARDQLALFAWNVGLTFVGGTAELSPSVLGALGAFDVGASVLAPAIQNVAEPLQQLVAQGLEELAVEDLPAQQAAQAVALSLVVSDSFDFQFDKMVAGRVTATEAVEALDGETYVRVDVSPKPELDPDVELAKVKVLSPSLSARPSGFTQFLDPVVRELFGTGITLDSLYNQITAGSLVIVQRGDQLHPAQIAAVGQKDVQIANDPADAFVPATHLSIRPQLPSSWHSAASAGRLVVHFHMIDGGRLTRVAETLLGKQDLEGGAELEGPVEPLETDPPDEVQLLDADQRGLQVGAAVQITAAGKGTLTLGQDEDDFPRPLRTPVEVYGNLIAATRGESVIGEVLGSGDPSRALQSFTLAQKPLTYLNDPAAADGRRSTLALRVDGRLWKEVPSFFGAGPGDEVYIVRQNDDDESIVTFGDGVRGSRLPSGLGNLVADYRFGAGAAKPPAGTIHQLARPVKGLRRVVNPVAAGGGADADKPKDLRRNAPRAALTLGRAISLADFEALAYEFGGTVQASATWAWDGARQRAVVKLWFISDGGDIAAGLRAFLLGQAAPETPLDAAEATPVRTPLIIDLVVDERYDSDRVELAVAAALTDADTGILALENIPIGCPLFRSRIFEQVLAVEGTVSVRAMTVGGKPAKATIPAPEGHYRNFLPDLVVGNTAVGDVLFAQAAQVQISNQPAFVGIQSAVFAKAFEVGG